MVIFLWYDDDDDDEPFDNSSFVDDTNSLIIHLLIFHILIDSGFGSDPLSPQKFTQKPSSILTSGSSKLRSDAEQNSAGLPWWIIPSS